MYLNAFSAALFILQNLFLFLLHILSRVCCSSMFKELLELPLSAVYLWVYGDMKSTSWCYFCFSLWCRSVQPSRGPLSLDMWLRPAMEECNFGVCTHTHSNLKLAKVWKNSFKQNSFQNVTLNVNNCVPRISLHACESHHSSPTLAITAAGPWARPLTPESVTFSTIVSINVKAKVRGRHLNSTLICRDCKSLTEEHELFERCVWKCQRALMADTMHRSSAIMAPQAYLTAKNAKQAHAKAGKIHPLKAVLIYFGIYPRILT